VPKSPAVHYGLATAALLMALLAKPAAVAVPLVVAVLEAGQPGRRRWRRMLLSLGPWFLLSAAWVVVTKLQQPDAPRWFVPPLWARPLLAGDALAFYVLKLVAPLSCGPDYGRTPRWVIEEGRFYLYAAWLLPAVLLIALACLRNRRVWLTAAGISIAWLVPVLGLVPFDYQRISTVADRYLYLALLGPAVALCWFLAHRWSRPAVALTAVVLCILGGLSFLQTAHWRNDAALFGHALRVNPHSAVAHHHLGILLAKQGEHSAAIARYRTALADHPQHAELHDSLGVSLAALEKTEEAVETLREAVRLAPGWADARYNLAKVLRREGHKKEAVEHLRKAVEAAPEHFLAHLDLGTALESLHRPDQARRHYRAVLRIRPDWPAAHFNLGNLALAELGGAARAAEHYRAALKFDPDYAKAHANLGMALFVLGKPREAIEHHRAALRIDPRLLPAQLGLAQALVAEGRHAEAEAEFRCALRLVPADSQPARQIREMLRQSQEHLSPVKSPQWKSLFDGKRLGRWEVVKEFDFINHGEVTVDQGNLVLGKGKPGTAVRFTGQFPKLDYEVSLEAMRVEGEDFFCGMTFPIGEKALTLIVGGWNGPVVGLSCIDDEPAVENETCLYMEFKQKRWYRIRLRVTAARITAWIDDEQIIDLPTEGRKLTIWFEPETVLPLGIATWKTKGALRNIRLRRLGQ